MNEKPCSALPRRHSGAEPALRSGPLLPPPAEPQRRLPASASASLVSGSEEDPCGELSGELSADERHYLVAAR